MHAHVYLCACTHVYVCTHVRLCVCAHTCAHVCTCRCVHVHAYMCACVCVNTEHEGPVGGALGGSVTKAEILILVPVRPGLYSLSSGATQGPGVTRSRGHTGRHFSFQGRLQKNYPSRNGGDWYVREDGNGACTPPWTGLHSHRDLQTKQKLQPCDAVSA